VRFAIRLPEQNERLLGAVTRWLEDQAGLAL
jgi:hypothetical protein